MLSHSEAKEVKQQEVKPIAYTSGPWIKYAEFERKIGIKILGRLQKNQSPNEIKRDLVKEEGLPKEVLSIVECRGKKYRSTLPGIYKRNVRSAIVLNGNIPDDKDLTGKITADAIIKYHVIGVKINNCIQARPDKLVFDPQAQEKSNQQKRKRKNTSRGHSTSNEEGACLQDFKKQVLNGLSFDDAKNFIANAKFKYSFSFVSSLIKCWNSAHKDSRMPKLSKIKNMSTSNSNHNSSPSPQPAMEQKAESMDVSSSNSHNGSPSPQSSMEQKAFQNPLVPAGNQSDEDFSEEENEPLAKRFKLSPPEQQSKPPKNQSIKVSSTSFGMFRKSNKPTKRLDELLAATKDERRMEFGS